MSDDLEATATDGPSQQLDWLQALDDLERCLLEASRAVVLLRHGLQNNGPSAGGDGGAPATPVAPQGMPAPAAPPPSSAATSRESTPAPPAPPEPAAGGESSAGASAFDRLWERIEGERTEKQPETTPSNSEERPRLDSLPQQYLMTVEDREGKVDLVPLHRALADLTGVEEAVLVSYTNGVPIISLRVVGELNLDELGTTVGAAMDRECEVIPQDMGKLYLRMKAVQG